MKMDKYYFERERMVKEQLAARGITDTAVLDAFLNVQRHLFVPEKHLGEAYEDHPLGIGQGQTISQPYIVALMLQMLELKKSDKVLEVGTGSGYQTALLAETAGKIYSIEVREELMKKAEDILSRLGYNNVSYLTGDGAKGWLAEAPFDKIAVSAAPEKIPAALTEQLKEGGIMAIPVGDAFRQELVKVTKKKGRIEKETICGVAFVPLITG